MKSPKKIKYEEVIKDLKFLIRQTKIIEHEQDYKEIKRLHKKYGN